MAKWNADAANIAAERDEWKRRAEVAEERLRAVEAENEAIREWTGKTVNDLAIKRHSAEAELAQADDLIRQYSAALFIISEKTECVVTRKIAREVLGPELLAQGAAMFAQKGGAH